MNCKCPDYPHNSLRPTLNGAEVELVASYCYLGVIISSNGKFTQAVESLYKKGLGAYFSLRNTVDRRYINPKNLNKLFNSLVTPVLTYGCQVWLPTLPIIKHLRSCLERDGNINLCIPKIARMGMEQVHLRHVKYLLGVRRNSSNSSAWVRLEIFLYSSAV